MLEKAPASGLRVSCLDSLSKICLFLSSPQWPASFTFRSFLLPPVACESQVPPIEGVGGTAWSPISKAKICLSDGAAGLYGLRPAPAMPGEQEFYPGNVFQGSEEGSAAPGSFPTHHDEVHLNCLGVMLRIDSRNALPSGQRGRSTVPAKHFFSEILRLPGTGIAKMRPEPLCWPILGLCWPICCLCLGAMFAHLEVMLGLCWPILAPCWTMLRARLDRRVPAEVIWGYVVFMTSPSVPKFCLKTLSPVACEAPTPFLQRYFSEKAESCWGRAHPR